MSRFSHAAFLLVFLKVSGGAQTPPTIAGFGADLSGCIESIGVTMSPTANVRAAIPADVRLVGDGQPLTPLVVRTSRCEHMVLDGAREKDLSIVQIGAMMQPRDSEAFVESYSIYLYASDAKFTHALQRLGVSAQHVPNLDYRYKPQANSSSSALSVAVSRPGNPGLLLVGLVAPPSGAVQPFIANWWQNVNGGIVRMNTFVPALSVGGAGLFMTFDASGALGRLFGANAATFNVLQQFNSFPTARTQVHLLP